MTFEAGSRERGPTPGPRGEAKGARQAKGKSRGTSRKGTLHSARESASGVKLSEGVSITRALRVEIAKPLGATWDDMGPQLRLYRSLMHRLYNAAIFGSAVEDECGEVYKLEGKSRAYQMAVKTALELREWGASKGTDAAEFNPCGGLMSAVAREARQKLQKWNKDRRRDRIPSFKYGAPIPVRAQESNVFSDGTSVVVEFKLASVGRWRVAVVPSKGTHWEKLRQIASGSMNQGMQSGGGDVKRGALKITYCERKKKWYALIAYTEDVKTTELDASRKLIVHRGQHNFLWALDSGGGFNRQLARGNKYLQQRRAIEARQKSQRSVSSDAERGGGAKGHGRKRRYATSDALSGKLDRINKTTCQQLASAAVTLARRLGCGTVVIEDYGGIEPDEERGVRRFVERFPLYQLKESIAHAVKVAGLKLEEAPSLYISTECPACGHTNEKSHNHRTNVFHCRWCGFERPADFVATVHMARSAGASEVWDKRLKAAASLASGEVVQGGEQQETSATSEQSRAKKRTSRKPERKGSKSKPASEGGRKR